MFTTTNKYNSELNNPSKYPIHHGRGLLWLNENPNISETYTTSTTNTSSSSPYLSSINNRNSSKLYNTNNNNNSSIYPTCPIYINQTESIRLASELRRWIGTLPEYFNLTTVQQQHQQQQLQHQSSSNIDTNFDINIISNYLLTANAEERNYYYKNINNVKKLIKKTTSNDKKKHRTSSITENEREQSKTTITTSKSPLSTASLPLTEQQLQTYKNNIQIYDPIYNSAIKYAELFQQIHRQDDTFYVVSFSDNHLLLPALAHNKTFRPKMSLMLPALNGSYSKPGYVTLMQIDCEVYNTSFIQIKENSIPDNMRTDKQQQHQQQQPINTANNNNDADIRYKSDEPSSSPVYNKQSTTTTSSYSSDSNNGTTVNDKSFDKIADEIKQHKPYFIDKMTFINSKSNHKRVDKN